MYGKKTVQTKEVYSQFVSIHYPGFFVTISKSFHHKRSYNYICYFCHCFRSWYYTRELKQPRRRRQQKPHELAYLTMKNSIFARFARAFFISWHFEDVLVLSTTWNDLFCSCVDDVSIWWQMLNFVSLCPKRWFQFNSRMIRTHFSRIMTLNNWKIIAETRSSIFRWRSRFCRRRVCLSSLVLWLELTLLRSHFKCLSSSQEQTSSSFDNNLNSLTPGSIDQKWKRLQHALEYMEIVTILVISLSLGRFSWHLSKCESFGASNEDFKKLWYRVREEMKHEYLHRYPTSPLSGANNHCKRITKLTYPALALSSEQIPTNEQ